MSVYKIMFLDPVTIRVRSLRGGRHDRWSCFFFQAEDGIRDLTVTGVQTCALPILGIPSSRMRATGSDRPSGAQAAVRACSTRPATIRLIHGVRRATPGGQRSAAGRVVDRKSVV